MRQCAHEQVHAIKHSHPCFSKIVSTLCFVFRVAHSDSIGCSLRRSAFHRTKPLHSKGVVAAVVCGFVVHAENFGVASELCSSEFDIGIPAL